MTIGRICRREVDLARGDESALAAAQRMATRNVGSLLVLDGARRPVGILTDRDIALRLVAAGRDAYTTTVAAIMTSEPHVVSEQTPIEDALAVMRAHGMRRLPVVDRAGALVGVVSLDDVVELLADEFDDVRRLLDKTSPRALT
ncbi:MAG: CBS domain-containing protein [Planctomycetes bacterium]|nr:CBS domain-containing protein [Planctomycetota bacterium]